MLEHHISLCLDVFSVLFITKYQVGWNRSYALCHDVDSCSNSDKTIAGMDPLSRWIEKIVYVRLCSAVQFGA